MSMSLKKMMALAAATTVLGCAAVSGAYAAETGKTGVELLAGVDHVQWLDVNRLIASQETESGRIDYLLHLNTGKFEKLMDAENASELVVSPDGSKAAYTDSTGAVFLLDLATKTSTNVSTDTNMKPEMLWSNDSKYLYYLLGDKGTAVNMLDIATGKAVPVLEDKKDYKSNLQVSAGGKTLTYTLTIPPVVTAPSDKPVDADEVAIDDSAAALNIYKFSNDASLKDNKPVQLSKSNEDKIFVSADPFGFESYFIVPADASGRSKLAAVTSDGTERTLFSDEDVFQAQYAGGLLYVLTSGPAGKNLIYTVNPLVGTSSILYTVPDTVSQIEVSKSGLVAIEMDGKTYVDMNGEWKPITR
jgi:hypothetical protein